MTDGSRKFYDTLSTYSDLEELIREGETEGLYLECKAPATPQLNKDMKVNFARALSGFSNTAGGVIIWGISTTKHEHTGLDVLSQIEPLGNCKLFARQTVNMAPTLTSPPLAEIESKIITKNKGDTRGVVITYIPKKVGDPVQSIIDNTFYFRSGDDFSIAPYEMIKRLFAATDGPDLHLVVDEKCTKLAENDQYGIWKIPIVLCNDSVAIAAVGKVSIHILNPDDCDTLTALSFRDYSDINPGEKVFAYDLEKVIYRGMNYLAGYILVKMKVEKRAKRLLKVMITIYANKMRARKINATFQLAKKGFSVIEIKESDLY